MSRKTNTSTKLEKPKADLWFESAERNPYDIKLGELQPISNNDIGSEGTLSIWNKTVNFSNSEKSSKWTTMMPGFPDGSFGWAATERLLAQHDQEPRLYFDYVGMGDSDKPEEYIYSVQERADLVESLWRYYDIKETLLVTFDFSSLVALELLSRQLDRQTRGLVLDTTIKKVLFINGGLFADSHSHPFMTTPLLKTFFGRMGAKIAQRSKFAFNLMMKDLWSKEYGISKEELAEIHNAVGRRNGALFMSDAAGFVDEHLRNAKRWNLQRVFTKTYPHVKYMVAGSEKDQFEYKQVVKAKKLLEHLGLPVKMFPGGHMTTSEYPHLIVDTIQNLKTI